MASVDQILNDSFAPIGTAAAGVVFYAEPFTGLEIKPILLWLVVAAVFFTLYLGFINLRGFKHAVDLVRGKFDKEGDAGQISRFQALSTSLSGTVGLGNIAGVAVAVSLGGPGAVFWMVLMGFLGMSTKFVEVMLGVKYRVHGSAAHPDKVSGGPMYYLRQGFADRGWPRLGILMGGLFALCGMAGVLGAGPMFQSNQSFAQVMNVMGGESGFWGDKRWIFGLILAVLVGMVILGGIKSIAKTASRIVPFMGILYLATGLIVILMNWQHIPAAVVEIFTLAFDPHSAYGGILGALLVGVQRASFSNEAGLGSAAIAHSAVKTDQPVSQGFVGMLGPFIDTVVICLTTALVIVVSGVHHQETGVAGVELTSRALESGIWGGQYILTLVVLLFAYSTMISWYYYGEKCLTYLIGERDKVVTAYKIFYCAFIVVGSVMVELENVVNFTDSMVFAMAIPNIIGLYVFAPEVKRDLKDYWNKVRRGSQ
ncbi:MAG: alanine:cation symporter family protein [Rhodospirillales bacterium]|nr:alanine:cation symporter family protein [Rhodospirillales bacterium]